ncbi:MAG TPA: hypothetical protein PK176_09550 [Acidobacteriota bacterium]|nr:hypothetical protein [Acidobacteriota bacterium]HQM63543.1 hypothetical protein [Acidobacteriota bacterium]
MGVAPQSPAVRRLVWAILLAGAVALLATSAYRAATFPFTHDESLSFAIFNWDPGQGATANNHLLNTLLMQGCAQVFGHSEFALRLPNLLAHVLYLVGTLALLRRCRSMNLRLAGFVILNLNLLALDFFCLARGYGLALAFQMTSLLLLARACERRRQPAFRTDVVLAVLAGSLAVLANFAFLNYHLPLLLASAWLLLTDASLRRFQREGLPAAVALLGASGVFVGAVLFRMLQLQRLGELYFGGNTGFVPDTVIGLVRSARYAYTASPAIETTAAAMIIGTVVALALLGAYPCFRRRKVPLFALPAALLTAAVLLPVLQHLVFQTLYPKERTALFYLPLFATALIAAVDWLTRRPDRRWPGALGLALIAGFAAVLGWQFARSFDPHTCYTWRYDAHNDAVLRRIDQDRRIHRPDRIVRLGINWMMEPSLNFYRVTRGYDWLAPVTRTGIDSGDYDYIYAFAPEVRAGDRDRHTWLAAFPDTQTMLVRVDRVPEASVRP